jgi:hypothetical protein
MKIELNVNGLKYEASYTDKEINEIIKPLLEKFQKIKNQKKRRIIVFLAAPPAVGKSTFSIFMERLSNEMNGVTSIQHLSLDGFHYPNEYLENNKIEIAGEKCYLSEIKGMPETFDLESFKLYLDRLKDENIKWPIYDRQLHDVVMDQVQVTSDIVVIEGNWLLLDEPGWRDLKEKCDYSIFIQAEEKQLKERLIHRKIKGGLTPKEALEFYKRSDGKNVKRVMKHQLSSDLVLKLQHSGELEKIKGEL